MTPFAHFVLFANVPIILLVFALLPPRRAVIVSLIGSSLFMPLSGYEIPGFPAYSKGSARSVELSSGGTGFHLFRLAVALQQLGAHEEARDCDYCEVEWTERNNPFHEELGRFGAAASALLDARSLAEGRCQPIHPADL
jgi:hypothetical protein